MEEQHSKSHLPLEVRHRYYSDASMVNLFNAGVSIMNGEQNLIWQRFNIMLVANSVILGFLSKSKDLQLGEMIGGTIFGLLLCVAWLSFTRASFSYFSRWMEELKRFFWTNLPEANPIKNLDIQKVPWGGYSYLTSKLVIALFMVSYVFLLFSYCYYKK
jgi:hypothetical protein